MVLDLTIHQDTFNSFKLKSADVRKVYYIVRCFRIHVALRLLLMSKWLSIWTGCYHQYLAGYPYCIVDYFHGVLIFITFGDRSTCTSTKLSIQEKFRMPHVHIVWLSTRSNVWLFIGLSVLLTVSESINPGTHARFN